MASNAIPSVGHIPDIPEDEPENGAVQIDKLPNECIDAILAHLSQQDLLSLTLVSKRLHSLTDRAIRLAFESDLVKVVDYPSLRLQRFGSSIKRLSLRLETSEEIVKEIGELCPNLQEMSFVKIFASTFSKPFFHKMLSQLHNLSIERLLDWQDMPTFQSVMKAALECCDNLTTLSLGRDACLSSNFQPFLQVVFPKLHTFDIDLDIRSANELFTPFIQSHSTIKSLWVRDREPSTPLTGILELNQLEQLSITVFERVHIVTIIPKLYQLSELKHLTLSTDFDKAMYTELFSSFEKMHNLTHLIVKWHSNEYGHVHNFGDDDLMQLQNLPQLQTFHLVTQSPSTLTKVSLPGVLHVLKHCRHLTYLFVAGMGESINTIRAREIIDMYSRLSTAHYELNDSLVDDDYVYNCGLEYLWYHFGCRPFNMIGILQVLLE